MNVGSGTDYGELGKRANQYCPDHGLVLAKRKVWDPVFYWAMVLVTFGQVTPDFPYRCPRCGSQTTRRARADHTAVR